MIYVIYETHSNGISPYWQIYNLHSPFPFQTKHAVLFFLLQLQQNDIVLFNILFYPKNTFYIPTRD